MKNKIWWRLILLIVIAGFFIVLGFKYFAFAGEVEYNYSFDSKEPQMSLLSPLARVSEVKCEENDCWQEIIADPVYFKTQIPVSFDRATVDLEFKAEDQPIFDLGVSDGRGTTMYTIKNDIFVELLKESKHELVDKDVILLQADKNYNNIEAFLKNVPYNKKIATYNYELNYSVVLPKPEGIEPKIDLKPMVQGDVNAIFYLYGRDLDLSLDFLATDSQADKIKATLYRFESNKTLEKYEIKENHLGISKTDLIPGTYGLAIHGNGMQVLENISINTDKLVFDGILTLSPELNRSTEIYTQAIQTHLIAFNEQGLQTVQQGESVIEITQREKLYSLTNYILDLQQIQLTKGGLKIQTDSVLAFNQQQFFNPKPYNFRAVQQKSQSDSFDYIIANYQHPILQENGWYKQKIDLNLAGLDLTDDSVEFVLSAPGIEQNGGRIQITNIKIEFFREPIGLRQVWNKVF